MIAEDQPRILPKNEVLAAVSSRQEGNMSMADAEKAAETFENRRKWLEELGIDIDKQVVVLGVTYSDENSYKDIELVTSKDAGSLVKADVLVTRDPNVALFLPVADCIGTIIYDKKTGALALAHLGRHATVAGAAEATIEFFKDKFGSDPEDIVVWMGPAIGIEHHDVDKDKFNPPDPSSWDGHKQERGDKIHLDIQTYNEAAFMRAGVPSDNIEICRVNTAHEEADYFSHRAHVNSEKDKSDISEDDSGSNKLGRFAVVTMKRDDAALAA